jgi:hypothetical protein
VPGEENLMAYLTMPIQSISIKYFVMKARGVGHIVFEQLYRGSTGHHNGGLPHNSDCIWISIDPISAMWMGLVTAEDLGLPENTIAVLKLAMQDIIS